MSIKLIFSDVDGTIWPIGGRISDRTRLHVCGIICAKGRCMVTKVNDDGLTLAVVCPFHQFCQCSVRIGYALSVLTDDVERLRIHGLAGNADVKLLLGELVRIGLVRLHADTEKEGGGIGAVHEIGYVIDKGVVRHVVSADGSLNIPDLVKILLKIGLVKAEIGVLCVSLIEI